MLVGVSGDIVEILNSLAEYSSKIPGAPH